MVRTWNAPRTDSQAPGLRLPQVPPGQWRRISRRANLCTLSGIERTGACLRIGLIAILLLVGGAAAADEIKAPKLSIATVDWDAARAALNEIEATRRLSATAHAAGVAPDLLERLNQATAAAFANIAASPVPVLLPFDLDAYLRAKAGEEVDYLAGFGAPKLLLTGPAGYDASFSVPLSETNSRTVDIHLSGFAFLYDLPPRSGGEEKPLNGLHADF